MRAGPLGALRRVPREHARLGGAFRLLASHEPAARGRRCRPPYRRAACALLETRTRSACCVSDLV